MTNDEALALARELVTLRESVPILHRTIGDLRAELRMLRDTDAQARRMAELHSELQQCGTVLAMLRSSLDCRDRIIDRLTSEKLAVECKLRRYTHPPITIRYKSEASARRTVFGRRALERGMLAWHRYLDGYFDRLLLPNERAT